MIVACGGRPAAEVAALLERASRAVLPRRTLESAPARRFTLSAARTRIERERMRAKVDGTAALAGALREGLANYRAAALRSFGLREAVTAAELDRFDFDPRHLANAILPHVEEAYRAGAQSAHDELTGLREGAKKPKSTAHASVGVSFDAAPQAAIDALYQRELVFATDVVAREKVALKSVLLDSLQDGDGPEQTADRIRDYFADGIHIVNDDGEITRTIPSDTWIDTVAKTEISNASATGTMTTYQQAGVEKIMWLTAEDERVCPECEPLDGEVVAIGDNFPGTDCDTPGTLHPSCRCNSVSAGFSDDDQAEAA